MPLAIHYMYLIFLLGILFLFFFVHFFLLFLFGGTEYVLMINASWTIGCRDHNTDSKVPVCIFLYSFKYSKTLET